MTVLRALKRRFGIAAPKVAVRMHVPWYWRVLATGALLGLVLIIAWGTFDVGRKLAGFYQGESDRERAQLMIQVTDLRSENDSLRRSLATLERELQMQVVTGQKVAQEVRALTDQNAALKEDLAFFQSLASSPGAEALAIHRFDVHPDALPGEYRFRALIAQPKQRVREFDGHLQLLVDVEQDGRASVLTLPRGTDNASSFRLAFRFFQRVDGVFTVPKGAVIRKITVRIFENGVGTPRLS
ncbi:MAG: hypothetical protein KIT73_17315, partial [Burkholderiales bacterium]|nr:hypothetical protein [Burkholderiales bacterium]